MKGVILAGGLGKRLLPCTRVTNKHLLPVYNRPMICYPLETLVSAGIRDILIVTGGNNPGDFLKLLRDGKEFGLKEIHYTYQEGAGGIAAALSLAEDFADGGKIVVILGDNIFEENIKKYIGDFERQKKGAKLFFKKVANSGRFGVGIFEDDKLIKIEEKSRKPKSNLVCTGLYMYDSQCFDLIRTLKPSERREVEITDVNNLYINKKEATYEILSGFWGDAGTFESLFEVSKFLKGKGSKTKKCYQPNIE